MQKKTTLKSKGSTLKFPKDLKIKNFTEDSFKKKPLSICSQVMRSGIEDL